MSKVYGKQASHKIVVMNVIVRSLTVLLYGSVWSINWAVYDFQVWSTRDEPTRDDLVQVLTCPGDYESAHGSNEPGQYLPSFIQLHVPVGRNRTLVPETVESLRLATSYAELREY